MSKRVEVREGDTWGNVNVCLLQKRGDKQRRVASTTEMDFCQWEKAYSDIITLPIPTAAARAWIESLGGEWAEVAEEKKATNVVAYVYDNALSDNRGNISLCFEGSEAAQWRDKNADYRRITIAVVTT